MSLYTLQWFLGLAKQNECSHTDVGQIQGPFFSTRSEMVHKPCLPPPAYSPEKSLFRNIVWTDFTVNDTGLNNAVTKLWIYSEEWRKSLQGQTLLNWRWWVWWRQGSRLVFSCSTDELSRQDTQLTTLCFQWSVRGNLIIFSLLKLKLKEKTIL